MSNPHRDHISAILFDPSRGSWPALSLGSTDRRLKRLVENVTACNLAFETAIDETGNASRAVMAAGGTLHDTDKDTRVQEARAGQAEALRRLTGALDDLFACPAKTLRGLLAKIDVVYRYGGEDAERALAAIAVDLRRIER